MTLSSIGGLGVIKSISKFSPIQSIMLIGRSFKCDWVICRNGPHLPPRNPSSSPYKDKHYCQSSIHNMRLTPECDYTLIVIVLTPTRCTDAMEKLQVSKMNTAGMEMQTGIHKAFMTSDHYRLSLKHQPQN
jgi:hypothetical protein